MRKRWYIWLLLLLLVDACRLEDIAPLTTRTLVPEGTPITITLGFGAMAPVEVQVGTKAEASKADEARVHDLYVLIFNSSGSCIYGKYFSYQERFDDIDDLIQSEQDEHEGWYVENKSLDNVQEGAAGYVSQTTGAVKLSTIAASGATLVLLANVSNTLTSLSGDDPITVLNTFKTQGKTLTQLNNLTVQLEQNMVERGDLFLMTGKLTGINTADMIWHGGTAENPDYTSYNTTYHIPLKHVDAKVKFRVKKNSSHAYIKEMVPLTWKVYNVPNRCTLFEQDSYSVPAGTTYFELDPPAYFEETVTDNDGTWEVFTFYMLESRLLAGASIPNATEASSYFLREKSVKTDDGDTGYQKNESWQYAPADAPYVVFTVSLVMDPDEGAIDDYKNWQQGEDKPVGASAEASFTVHLGEFCKNNVWDNNNYDTHRGRFYTYNVTINNTKSIFTEVTSFDPENPQHTGTREDQPGQEGSLLLISGGVVNCDAHYEYRSITFKYNESLARNFTEHATQPAFSWYVKTPFNKDKHEGEPTWQGGDVKRYVADPKKIDYLWVKFRVNVLEDTSKSPDQTTYSPKRQPYPGEDEYDADWYPGKKEGGTPVPIPKLMDINQLINFIYHQYQLEYLHDKYEQSHEEGEAEPEKSIFDSEEIIEITAFVDEYYYEKHPLTGQTDPDLWREFVNAEPREMHILSDVQLSRDRQSNIINASHSIIQRSIQTIYNLDAPDISSLWGTEHKDEMRETDGWSGWPWGIANGATTYANSAENGRLNSAALWGLYPSGSQNWGTFLKYDVINTLPELQEGYRYMAYSCLTRNRDNDGNGTIDKEEVRWYMASINQLKGMWIGNEALSTTARVYQPRSGDWRAHVISSTCPNNSGTPKVLNAEEGLSTFEYSLNGQSWADGGAAGERLRESVRCVRNLGTYKVGGVGADEDISYAPYTQAVDNYYTVEEKRDPSHPSDVQYSDYAIRFYRLNPLSIREFIDKELPFHNELSVNNKVYLELYVQSKKTRESMDAAYRDGVDMGDMGAINENITSSGSNVYCPEGYRLPNQSELGVMTLALPTAFWTNSATRIPSRTYFSHGYYALSGQQIQSENQKTGWVYSTTNSGGNVLLPDKGQITKQIRCVRDGNQTGTITGKMHLDKTYFNVGSQRTLYFNFTSSASAFAKVDDYADYAPKLYLCYKDEYGNDVQLDYTDKLNDEIDPIGKLRFDGFVNLTIPSDITPSPVYPAAMQFKIELTNGKSKPQVSTFYTAFTLTDNHGEIDGDLEILPGRDEEKGFPIYVSAVSNISSIKTLQLYVRKKGQSDYSLVKDLSEDASGMDSYRATVYFNPQTIFREDLQVTTYFFYVYCEDAGEGAGQATDKSSVKAMEVLTVDYTPNPTGAEITTDVWKEWSDSWWQTFANANGWVTSLDPYMVGDYNYAQRGYINMPYGPLTVRDLNFAEGDFIEADIDVSNCTFIQTVEGSIDSNPYKSQNIGLDNIFSIGKTAIDWVNTASNELHFYYPAHKGAGNDQLQLDPVVTYNTFSKLALGNLTDGKLVLRLDKDGAKYNGNSVASETRYDIVVRELTSSHSLIIGALEGNHLSRASYNYVRVIHNDISHIPHHGDSGFEGDPSNGGDL